MCGANPPNVAEPPPTRNLNRTAHAKANGGGTAEPTAPSAFAKAAADRTPVGSGDGLANQPPPRRGNDTRNWLALVSIRCVAGDAAGGRQVNRPATGARSKPVG